MMKRVLLFTFDVTIVGVAITALICAALRNGPGFSTIVVSLLAAWIVIVAIFGRRVWRTTKKKPILRRLAAVAMTPFILPALIAGVVAILAIAAVIWPISAVNRIIWERRLRAQMKAKGRYATLNILRPQLNAGRGTLIEETGHKGPNRLWWTEDDLRAPAPTKAEFMAIVNGEECHPFNSRCLSEYLDEGVGKALLTSIPPRDITSGKLARLFPRAHIAVVVRPFSDLVKARIEQ